MATGGISWTGGNSWARLRDIYPSSSLFGGAGPLDTSDVIQGEHADCWLASAMAAATKVSGGEFLRGRLKENGDGTYTVALHQAGETLQLTVDDRVPTTADGAVAFTTNRSRGDGQAVWAAVLEKAVAQLYGSYDVLEHGNLSEALASFTGGHVSDLSITDESPERVWAALTAGVAEGCAMGCSRVRQANGTAAWGSVEGSVALSLCTAAHSLYTRFTNRFGTSISETTMRPNPMLGRSR
jgi:hypothetical protein